MCYHYYSSPNNKQKSSSWDGVISNELLKGIIMIKMQIGTYKHCNLSSRCSEIPGVALQGIAPRRWVWGCCSSTGRLEVKQWWTQQSCAQQVVLNNRQKAPRRKLKLEFDYVWAFPQREVQRSRLQIEQAALGCPEESPGVNEERWIQDKQFQTNFPFWSAHFKKLSWVFLGV